MKKNNGINVVGDGVNLVETRKIIGAVHTTALAGVVFIPVPFPSEDERIELLNLSNSNLEKLATITKSEGTK